MLLERTYEIQESPERPMSWDDYQSLITDQWESLLNREPPPTEPEVQAFFEQYPSIVPGAFTLLGNESGHYPWLCGLITQPPLPSYNKRVPDFMWLSECSDTEQPVLIEIEAPSKRWFTQSGKQTENLTQALNQIAEWKAWFSVSYNVEAFKAFYGLDRVSWRRRRFRPAYLLIYGRRTEANRNPELTQKRTYLHADDVISMTYDRIGPNPKALDFICLKAEAQGVFRAVSVPATLRWSPDLADDRALIQGLDAAIEANPHIPPQRKAFLIQRRPYWDKWARLADKGVIHGGDEE